ncbi:hypothetical protein PGT21_016981 [Puccinia graminis f. sp. tritici]|uniref:hAT-like transposase RNase-H fold domain-containing protein n=1 Tax=Puccinia graminis f. sp. tritici TaxID=56615 RepID=A0A5B0R903_PUCGR|nr:hypothetical protein PGT21_016981 [Puccinia graminis f. sp. tritici]KAA1121808.1 hypothetical protein PGTUg99_031749 [Puccinia graminis f. sp. tritici]
MPINTLTGINHPLPSTHHTQKLHSTHSNNLFTIKYSALILNAGLCKALRLSNKGLVESRGDTLGFAPDLAPIIGESEECEEPNQFVAEDVALEFRLQGQVESRTGSDGCNGEGYPDSSDIPDNGGSNIDTVLKKVDFIIQRITSSSAKRSEYNMWCTKLDFNGLSLIAGYEQEGGKNYFDSVEVSRSDWEMVNRLNDTLSEFYFLTKKMEGDHSSGCLLISEYQYIKEFLTIKIKSPSEPEFKKIFKQMLAKTNTYLNEALCCDVILIATALNPSFCLLIFKFLFPSHHNYTQDLLESLFNTRKAEITKISVPTKLAPPVAGDKSKSIKQA